MADKKVIFHCIFRILLGFVFLYAGIIKVFAFDFPNVEAVMPFMAPATTVFLLGLLELIIGVMIMVGLFTRIFAWIMAGMLLIFIIVGPFIGTGFLYKNLALIGAAMFLAVDGAQLWSLDTMLQKSKT